MKKGIRITLFVIVLFGCIGGYYYIKLKPVNHFAEHKIPQIATPEKVDELKVQDSLQSNEEGEKQEENADITKGRKAIHLQKKNLDKKYKQIDSFNLLLLGLDARKQEASRTDVIMLANIHPEQEKITVLSIPRDTLVQVEGVGATKINHAHLLGELEGGNGSGTEATIQTVSNLCKCTINYYVKTNFEGFIDVVDAVGGIEIELKEPITLTDKNITLDNKNILYLDGDLALSLVRERKSLSEGDFGRQQHQALVLKSLVKTALQPKNIPKVPTIYRNVKQAIIDTNVSESDIFSMAMLFKGITTEDISYFQLPGNEGYAMDPLVNSRLYYWIPDVNEMNELLKHFNKE
ncbi:LCP family protein [Bacillus sp. SM2101]|uniref:LCP family protein n=1 Tax=Bacillus sp. SM2101 TaxID=2805366 RepID=UPI001BDE36BE|nr:LCP family protein [Bacillus sp. SM2101]